MNEVRIAQLADDTTVFVKNSKSVDEVLNIMMEFERLSGLKVNKEKSEAVWIGCHRNSKHKCGYLKWSTEPVKVLGVYVGYDKDKCNDLNWEPRLKKLENTFNSWKMRNLTPIGKIQIIKTFGLSNLIYLASILDVPLTVVDRVNSLIYDFLDCAKYKIKKGVLMAPFAAGGLNAPSFKELALALKFTWLRRFLDDSNGKWKNMFAFLFQSNDKEGILCSSIDPYNIPSQISNNMSLFYTDCLRVWLVMRSMRKKCQKHLSWNHLYKIFISVLENNLNTFYLEHHTIDIQDLNTKAVYGVLVRNIISKTDIVTLWERECGIQFVDNIWLFAKSATPEIELHSFHWKFILRRLPTNLKLSQWGRIDSPLCSRCKVIDTYKHRYWDCVTAASIWKYVQQILSVMLKRQITLHFGNSICGLSLKNKSLKKASNLVILIARWSIHKYHVGNLSELYPSTLVVKSELYQRAEAQQIQILLDACSLL